MNKHSQMEENNNNDNNNNNENSKNKNINYSISLWNPNPGRRSKKLTKKTESAKASLINNPSFIMIH